MTHLGRVQLVLPFRRHVVGVLDDLVHEQFRIDDTVLVRQHASSDREDGPENTNIEQDSSTGRDLEMQERVGIDERKEDEDGGE